MMMKRQKFVVLLSLCLVLLNCADDQPFLSNFIKRASDAILTPCDPYNKGVLHTCLVFSSAFNQSLVVYDASASELVLSPMLYFPLKVKVGPATNNLTTVKNVPQKFPYFLALDPSQAALYVVRAFGDTASKERSFEVPLKQNLTARDSKPYKMAAWANNTHVLVVLSYPSEGVVEIVGLHKATGRLDPAVYQSLKVGTNPSHLAINNKGIVIISDEGSKNIHEFSLKDLNKPLVLSSHDVGMHSERLYAEERDFGNGSKVYIAILEAMGNSIKLYNFTDKKVESSLALDRHASAAYFPDAGSDACCGGEKQWLAVIDDRGLLKHLVIKREDAGLTLKEGLKVDLTAEKNLSLSQLTVIKIVGGSIIFDPSLGRERSCKNDRKMFFISSFALSRPYDLENYLGEQESVEIEAQGQSCEGDGTANRFGIIEPEERHRSEKPSSDKSRS